MLRLIIAGIIIGIFLLVDSIRLFFLKRTIENIPTSKIRSIAMGFVELKGKVKKFKGLKTPFTNKPCVLCIYSVDRPHKGAWKPLHTGIRRTKFYLQDVTGKVLIDPKKLKIDKNIRLHTEHFSISDEKTRMLYKERIGKEFLDYYHGPFRLTEKYLAHDDHIYLLGTADSRPESHKAVKSEEKIVIKRGAFNKTFYLSRKSEEHLLKEMRKKILPELIGGFVLLVGSLAALFAIFDIL
jgi:hypothetical protein